MWWDSHRRLSPPVLRTYSRLKVRLQKWSAYLVLILQILLIVFTSVIPLWNKTMQPSLLLPGRGIHIMILRDKSTKVCELFEITPNLLCLVALREKLSRHNEFSMSAAGIHIMCVCVAG